MKKVDAELRWFSREEGGRSRLPSGPTYSTMARFASQEESWAQDAWSLVVEFVEPPDQEGRQHVKVNFLAPGGPEEFLRPGSKFELMEGARVVARGRMLD